MSDTEERAEALGGQEGPVGAGSDESVRPPGPVVEGPEEGLVAAGLEQGDHESSSGEESETESEEEEEEEDEEEAAELGEQATGVDQHHFQIASFHLMYLDLVPSLLRHLYRDGQVIHARGHVFRRLRQDTPSESHSMPELSASLRQGLHLPSAAQRPARSASHGLTFAVDLNLDLPAARLPPRLHELPELPQVLPTIQVTEAPQPTLLAIEAARPADPAETLEPSKPLDQADVPESREPVGQATASQEMTQYVYENSDEEGQKSGGEEEKKAKGEKDKENKEQEPEQDLDPEEGTSRSFSCLRPTKDFSPI